MVTKQEISEKINQSFPLEEDIDWSKLSKEDLLLIKPLLSDPKDFIKKFAMDKGEERVADMIMLLHEGMEERRGEDGELKIGEGKIISSLLKNL